MTYKSIKSFIKKEDAEALPDNQLIELIHQRLNKHTRSCNRYASKDFLITADEDNLIAAIEFFHEFKGLPSPFEKREPEGQKLYDYYLQIYTPEEAQAEMLVIFGTYKGREVLKGLGVSL